MWGGNQAHLAGGTPGIAAPYLVQGEEQGLVFLRLIDFFQGFVGFVGFCSKKP
jgi:hypothetical protein